MFTFTEHVKKLAFVDYKQYVTPDTLFGITLRSYQVEAIKTLLDSVRGVAWMATNSGKTAVIAGIIKALQLKTLVVVNSKELLYQTSEMLQKRLTNGITPVCGLVGDSHREFGNWVTVTTIQTLHRIIDQAGAAVLGDIDAIIIDECHHAKAKTFDVLYDIPGVFRFGLSGTPLSYRKLDDLKLIAATGEVRVRLTNQDMIEQGVSVRPFIKIYPLRQRDQYADESYQEAYLHGIVQNNRRNWLISNLALKAAYDDQVVLVIVSQIEHGKRLLDLTQHNGSYCTFVHGSTAMNARERALLDMKKGIPGVYIATSIFDEGVDVAGINTLILAGGGKSNKKVLQRIGRGLRSNDGKEMVTVIDFYDDGNSFLRSHARERIHVYDKEGFDIEVMTDEQK
jgi:superfamily II DNA or RNA helicase